MRSLRSIDQTRQEVRSLQLQIQQMRWWIGLGLLLSLLSLGTFAALSVFIYYQWQPAPHRQSQDLSDFSNCSSVTKIAIPSFTIFIAKS
ncbi:hypothetical protein VB735_10530 [Halotia wernerae UHCC 0503]|nr:hypothetical protein [Halotia wernerae UHCC 0503]